MTRIRLRERFVRDTSGQFLVYEEDGRYDVPARFAGPLLRRGLAEKLDTMADVDTPRTARKAQLTHEEISDLEDDLLRNKRSDTDPSYTPSESGDTAPDETTDDEPDETADTAPAEADEDDDGARPVTDVDGVGPATRDKLADQGITSVRLLAEADPDELPDGVGPATVEDAQDLL